LTESATVSLVRRFFALALIVDDRRDELERMLDANVVLIGSVGGLDARRVVPGAPAVVDYLIEIGEPWEYFEVDVEQVLEEDDRVVALLRERGRSVHGGPEMQNETAMTFRFRDGKILEIAGYLDRDEALRAAELD
jgi:ketosteroid isomerase-like protein